MLVYLNKLRILFNFSREGPSRQVHGHLLCLSEMREAFVLMAMLEENQDDIENQFLGLAREAWQVEVGKGGELSMFLNATGIEYLEAEAGIKVWGAEFNATHSDLVGGIFCQNTGKIEISFVSLLKGESY